MIARFFPTLRAVAWLKRIALALERANEIETQKLARPRTSKMAEITVPSTKDWNEKWEREH